MAFREVPMFEVREVLRLWLRGEGFRSIDRLTRVDRKTVRRYVEAVRVWERVVQLNASGPFAQAARTHARSARDLQHIFAGAA